MRSREIALSGMLSALAVVFLLLGGVIPLATFCCPLLAIIALLPVLAECGPKAAGTAWAAVSLLAILLVPDRELAFVYVFFGWYPILRPHIQKLHTRPVRILCKLAFCVLSILVMYSLLLFVFQLDAVAADFQGLSHWMAATMLALGCVTFLLLDRLIEQVQRLWKNRLRKRFFRH